MSAPIIVSAAAGATPLLFESSICIALLTVVPVGMWAKVSISPLSELAREAGEGQPVGNADRPHIHRRSSSFRGPDVIHQHGTLCIRSVQGQAQHVALAAGWCDRTK